MNHQQQDLQQTAEKLFYEQTTSANEFAARKGITLKPQPKQSMANGSVEFGGALAAGVTLKLTFNSGEKRNFVGQVYGDAVGLVGGKGVYIGPVPKDGAKWNINLTLISDGPGGLQVDFNPIAGPHAVFTSFTAGIGAAKLNYGSGEWHKG